MHYAVNKYTNVVENVVRPAPLCLSCMSSQVSGTCEKRPFTLLAYTKCLTRRLPAGSRRFVFTVHCRGRLRIAVGRNIISRRTLFAAAIFRSIRPHNTPTVTRAPDKRGAKPIAEGIFLFFFIFFPNAFI